MLAMLAVLDPVGQVEVETITDICRLQFPLTLKPIATQSATASHAAWQFARLAVCVALEHNPGPSLWGEQGFSHHARDIGVNGAWPSC